MLRFSQPVLHRKNIRHLVKIQAIYFKIQGTYFKIYALYFCPHKYLMYSNIQEGFKMP